MRTFPTFMLQKKENRHSKISLRKPVTLEVLRRDLNCVVQRQDLVKKNLRRILAE